ncbi:MMPL family transporter [Acidipropionibacterium jensenii]|uniref:MMPL family transporter n=1 Tax=Acidipropionibacterium jensenii TaxID=1749 RepID=A0A3T0RWW1_9ACTN|nr:MMPL family transporter [Acidipropionibacterium jensenii]AZZ38723.1 MMPL family transporter [Acidipropionibacterium jensenii]
MDNDPSGHRSASRTPRSWLRVLVPALLILIWLAGAGVGGPYFGRVDEVSSNDATAYLPRSADATRVQELIGEFNDSSAIPAVVVMTSGSPLTRSQTGALQKAVQGLASVQGVTGQGSPAIPSKDGRAIQAFVPIDRDADVGEAVDRVRDTLERTAPEGIEVFVTGPAGFTADLLEAFSGIDTLLLGVALAAVLVILLIVYRSLLLPVVVLLTGVSALTVALLVVWHLARAGVLLLSGQTQGILFILVIGAATDYALLYVARYREALIAERDRWTATVDALKGSVRPIVASGGTVIAGLLCLMLSELKSNSTLGPVTSIGIVFAMLAALTFLPAMLLLMGRAAFWPRVPHFDPQVSGEVSPTGLWARAGRALSTRPRTVWVVACVILAVCTLGITQLRAQGVPQSDLVLGSSQARDGQRALAEHFPGGSGSPAFVVTSSADLQKVADVLLASSGVQSVAVSADTPAGTAPVTRSGIGGFGGPGTPAPEPRVVDGQVLLQATLADAADSDAAEQTVRDLRSELDRGGATALVGGVTATAIDTNDTSLRDRNLIIPLVLAVILVILMVLLRAVVAPLVLLGTTVLSFGATMGVAAMVFNTVLDLPGADPAVPLFGFVFLIALGIDYNIFLMTRVREESGAHGTRPGIIRGLQVTGGVITSAGLVLAATFAALSVIPILFLVQIAFIVAFGVLVDTFLVRAVLLPALCYDIGRPIWWPSHWGKEIR